MVLGWSHAEAPDALSRVDARRAALVYNPIKVDPARLRAQVTALCAEAGWREPLFFETTVDDIGDQAAEAALAEGADAVLVAGGDGTVRAVAHALAGRGVPLAILPSGTGNLLARNLYLPLDDAERMIAPCSRARCARSTWALPA